jgi:hypothetical protein
MNAFAELASFGPGPGLGASDTISDEIDNLIGLFNEDDNHLQPEPRPERRPAPRPRPFLDLGWEETDIQISCNILHILQGIL